MKAVVAGQIVKRPRHFAAYKALNGDVVIVRVLYDRREIIPHLAEVL